jgi:hypothetical protein
MVWDLLRRRGKQERQERQERVRLEQGRMIELERLQQAREQELERLEQERKQEMERKLEEAASLFKIDPLSDVTRKERVYLLGISAISIAIVFTGLIPTEIRTFGIKFGEANRSSLLIILALVVAYFLVAFLSYALSDLAEWQERRRAAESGRRGLVYESRTTIFFRVAIEFVVPIVAGGFAIAALLVRAL